MLPSLQEYISYFRFLSQKHLELKGSFVHGATERILSQSRSELNYPVLWLETPALEFSESGDAVYGDRLGGFVILMQAPTDDYAAQDEVWNQTEQIAMQVLARIRKERRAQAFRIDFNSLKMEAVSTLHVDNELGWRVEFRLKQQQEICYTSDKWLDGI